MRRKIYGQSRIDSCPFCSRQATISNSQGVPVCTSHRDEMLMNMKCACGGWLDLRAGKWGVYFNCIDCGNMNLHKALELNPQDDSRGKSEITVSSDEVDFL